MSDDDVWSADGQWDEPGYHSYGPRTKTAAWHDPSFQPRHEPLADVAPVGEHTHWGDPDANDSDWGYPDNAWDLEGPSLAASPAPEPAVGVPVAGSENHDLYDALAPDLAGPQILLRTRWQTFWWYAWHPVSRAVLGALATAAAATTLVPAFISAHGSVPPPTPTAPPTVIHTVTAPPVPPSPSTSPTVKRARPSTPARRTPHPTHPASSHAPAPQPATTVIFVPPPPPPTSVAPAPRTSAAPPPVSSSATSSATISCNAPVSLTVTGTGSGSNTLTVSGPGVSKTAHGSPVTVTVNGPSGTYYINDTDSGGHPSASWNATGATCR